VLAHSLEGSLVAYEVSGLLKAALVAGPDHAAQAERLIADGARLIAQGQLRLRLGVALYDRPFLFVPHTIIDEAGALFRGELVLDWLRLRAHDMPRSEVLGVNARGKDDQVFARDVDVESSPIVVGGPDESPVYVVCRIGAAQLPPRFTAALRACASHDPPDVRKTVESA
jgi:hypothetical protein